MFSKKNKYLSNNSKTLLEGLIYKIPSIKNIYQLIDLEPISSSEHPEINNIIINFKNPDIIISIGILVHCYIIQREKSNTFHYIEISSEAMYGKLSRAKLAGLIFNNFNMKECMPEPFSKKIIYISNYDKPDNLQGIMYSQVKGGLIKGNLNFGEKENKNIIRVNIYKFLNDILKRLNINDQN